MNLDAIIPEVKKVLDSYYQIEVNKERNELLKTIIDHIDYYREPGKRLSKPIINIYPKLQ
ncbi:hypothetical protein [Paraclostridium bifermentans]|uniref:hypothetical protein n=1 Tax=Paraclostridium bifermentans TaxID=1490 RepID=UPI0018D017D2|nr:hypothetical protein [Paraclostridium bifermentans]